jgi:hypothetical protein
VLRSFQRAIGGSQRFYSNLIQRNPEVQFYFSGDGSNGDMPPNAHALRFGTIAAAMQVSSEVDPIGWTRIGAI